MPARQSLRLLSPGFVRNKREKGALIASVLVLDSSAVLEEWAPELEPKGSPAWLVRPGIRQRGPNAAISALRGFELGSGLSLLATSLASDLSNLDGTNIGAEVGGAAGHGSSASMGPKV